MNLLRFALHGGAGVIARANLSPEREALLRAALGDIAGLARSELQAGASALEVVEQAVRRLEDSPYFNAGHGAVLNHEGVAELDAAIMDGRDRSAGAVAAARRVRYPVSLAREVMCHGGHVLLVGAGADEFARARGLEQVPPDYFLTPDRIEQLRLARLEGRVSLDHDNSFQPDQHTGTVGAVARDQRGDLAAATSTGGMTNKLAGRVGDSPIIGAGTWADNRSCCLSATGHGEFFMRCVLAHDVHARMVYGGESLASAAAAALDRVADMGGTGGLIAIDHQGEVVLSFNSAGMYRAWVGATGEVHVGIFGHSDGA